MGLFSSKPPCPICGGKISWLFPTKIGGEHICDDCSSKIDMQIDIKNALTIQALREYLVFYEQNQMRKEKFVVSEKIDFGVWDTKIIFDYENRLFCMNKTPDKTIFEGANLKSFTVKEDSTPLIAGSASGITRYTSTVPERAMAMAPQISMFLVAEQMARTAEAAAKARGEKPPYRATMDIPEPFQNFNVELHLDHPYWTLITCDMSGPRFSTIRPDVNDYLRDYQRNVAEIEKLVAALVCVAFPQAKQQTIGAGMPVMQGVQTNIAPADPIGEIKKYKELLEQGLIDPEEFNAKKKQLMGI